jgi:hypothetical protein
MEASKGMGGYRYGKIKAKEATAESGPKRSSGNMRLGC